MLTEIQLQLWKAYEQAEKRAPRAERLLALTTFLNALTPSPTVEWFPWARSIAAQVVDQNAPFVIRCPLFARAIFPALLAGYQARIPGSARWLAGLSDNLWRCPGCCAQMPPNETTEVALLLEAKKHDPTDHRSRRRLVGAIADRLRFSLHEIPAGVLYGMDGASPEQCQELQAELDDFCRLVAAEGFDQRYAELIDACRLHFRAHREYMLNKHRYNSYSEYLGRHHGWAEN